MTNIREIIDDQAGVQAALAMATAPEHRASFLAEWFGIDGFPVVSIAVARRTFTFFVPLPWNRDNDLVGDAISRSMFRPVRSRKGT